MAEQTADQEPTMEEILASIRRIINEDDEGEQAEEAPEAVAEPDPEPEIEPEPEPEPEPEFDAEPEFEAEDEDDVLDLTDRVEEDDEADAGPMSVSDDLMILDREEEIEPEPEFEAEPEFEPEPEPAPVAAAKDDDGLLGAEAAGATSAAFAALSANLLVASQNGLTLEGIVRELLRPMLKQWLDENLPGIVEEKVKEEIERVARRTR
ncbi:DUF2497 domain-containing protein [Woodsholea maritima]|uniref:DUF2497 domain-containing protein n=1 Tax=Woodsholea maritima TaxID=240237 RepID=UPI0003678B7C|nr:DUF2497 domain-containing protein [Woodsholea maritima]